MGLINAPLLNMDKTKLIDAKHSRARPACFKSHKLMIIWYFDFAGGLLRNIINYAKFVFLRQICPSEVGCGNSTALKYNNF